MSTAAAVRTAWNSNVFSNSSVTAITDKVFSRRMDTEGEFARLRYGQEFNWIEYIVQRSPIGGQIGARRWEYQVEVVVNRELDPNSTNYIAALDAHETIASLVISELGSTWGATIDRWIDVSDLPSRDEIEVNGKRVVSVTQIYKAEKYI